ncbi:ankyrin repeat protein [Legionella massiliensis]|uniref:Ankyrin repeat protein n=1 Tax=Legionella massiliensis TaxID=1034943 RepID=A0A078KXZ8_9GAMM|nr:ankyrin repeat domain-containing protein [Legionella massiliensis]CDZ76613.1 ankyrin repeat protein [Legionella massiliensis]CEE12351.1 Ankyrin repeats (3 copies) [Legionella massiliensis]
MPGELSTSSSSSRSSLIDWQMLVQRHLPFFYNPSMRATNEQWEGFYQSHLIEIFGAFYSPSVLGSVEPLQLPLLLSEPEQKRFLHKLMLRLMELSNFDTQPLDLAILLHHRLSDSFAKALYDHAIKHVTGLSPLHWALICRQPITAEMATKINSRCARPPLHLAACFNDPELISSLVGLGANINLANYQGLTACYLAAEGGQTAAVERIVQIDGFAVHQKSFSGETPLWVAAKNDRLAIVELLLQAGAEANQANIFGITPLFTAVERGHIAIVKRLLLQEGIAVNRTGNQPNTLLQLAADNNHIEIIKLLIAHGASDGMVVLKKAIEEGNTKVIDALFASGLYISPQNSPSWLQQELFKRLKRNRQGGTYLMPIGYDSQGKCLLRDALEGNSEALSYFDSNYQKDSQALMVWFKNAGKNAAFFHLALKLVTARLAKETGCSEFFELERALISGHIDDLASQFSYKMFQRWLSALTTAPEMVNFSERFLMLTKEFQERHIAEFMPVLEEASEPGPTSETLSASASSSCNWQELMQSHLPSFYKPSEQRSNEQWQKFYQHSLKRLFKGFYPRTKKLWLDFFSMDAQQAPPSLESVQEELILELKSLWRDSALNLATFLHHRLPENLAKALYDYALTQESDLSPLHWALIFNQPIRVEMATGMKSLNNPPLLHLATVLNNPSLIDNLLKLGAEVNITSFQNQETSCFIAARHGRVAMLERLLQIEGIDINQANFHGLTPLDVAVRFGHLAGVDRLLQEKEIALNAAGTALGISPHCIAYEGRSAVVERLLQEGVNVQQVNSAFSAAVKNKLHSTINVLLRYGTKVGMEVLEDSVRKANTKRVDALFTSGLYISSRNTPPWLENELRKRIGKNTAFRENSLQERALSVLEETLFDESQIPSQIKGLVKNAVMPIGYTPKGRCIVPEAAAGQLQALAYFEAGIQKNPKVYAAWFRDAGQDREVFQLALNLLTARSLLIEFNAEERDALYSGRISDLEVLYSKYPYEVLRKGLNTLIAAPEMINYRESCLRLANSFNEKRITELELCQPQSQDRVVETGASSSRFFKPLRPGDRMVSAAQSSNLATAFLPHPL